MTERLTQAAPAQLQEHDLRRMALRRQEAELGVLSDVEIAAILAMRRATLARAVEQPADDSVAPGVHFEGDFGGSNA